MAQSTPTSWPYANGSMNSSEPLPLLPEELTPAWFTKTLGVKVTDSVIRDVIHGTSGKVLVELTYEASAAIDSPPKRLCVKGGFNPVIRTAYPTMLATYRREAEFYYYIAPATSMRLPKTYYAGTDTVNGQGVEIISDLKDDGCTFGDPHITWPVDRVLAGVEQLALLHAKTWGKEKEFPWLASQGGTGTSPVRAMILGMLQPEAWAVRFAKENVPPVHQKLIDRERVLATYEALWKTTDPRYLSVIHGDSHIGNTYITADGQPGFIDWQGLHYGSVFHDISYFVTSCLAIEGRRKSEENILEHYLESLHRAGGPKISKEDAWKEYQKHIFHGFMWALSPLKFQPEDVVAAMSERFSAAIIDHDILKLLEDAAKN
ncbi:kinase-like domain-containing protein [Biscogniauxia marginata]|nr:kinase-like domain-containing protein [Biscogniauxia marginata]